MSLHKVVEVLDDNYKVVINATINKTHTGTFISLLKIKNMKESMAPNANETRLLVS